jgi:hypothetical protein
MQREGLEPVDAPRLRGGFTNELFEAQMRVVIEERVPVYAAGLGDPGPFIEALHANGTRVMAVVGAVRHARKVAASGVDVIVAQGHDAGGHNSPVGTMALIPQVVDAVGEIPVLGAGGIVDGRGVAAAMMLGAQGVWVGSAFLATHEANIEEFQKKAIVESSEEGTTITRSVTGKPARYIKSKWTQAWVDAGLEPLPMPYQGAVSGPVQAAAFRQGRGDIAPRLSGTFNASNVLEARFGFDDSSQFITFENADDPTAVGLRPLDITNKAGMTRINITNYLSFGNEANWSDFIKRYTLGATMTVGVDRVTVDLPSRPPAD